MTETSLIDSNARSIQSAVAPERSEEQAAEFEEVMQGDRVFFLQHPDRDWYVRPITPVEVAEGRALGNSVIEDALVLVGELAPGSRVRLIFWDSPPPVEEFKAMQKSVRKEWGVKSTGIKDRLQHSSKGRPRAKGFGQKP